MNSSSSVHNPEHAAPHLSRRMWFDQSAFGLASIACAGLSANEDRSQSAVAMRQRPHTEPTARNVIFLFMSGGPSQVDTFDPKPELTKLHGLDVPESIANQVPRIQRAGLHNLMASPFKFSRHGQSGLPVSNLFPQTARLVDELCVIRSMQHANPVHGPGECVALTGTAVGDRPSLGSWVTYGLGNESSNLPAFVALNLNTDGMQYPQASGWGAGFLPASFQGVTVTSDSGIRHAKMPAGLNVQRRSRQVSLLRRLNEQHLHRSGDNSELRARLKSYELAFRLQSSGPELFSTDGETIKTRTMYGIDQTSTRTMGSACLLARRMVERGVRFIQIRFGGWDAHGNLESNHRKMASRTDLPIAGLLADLKTRGLLDQTLVVWGGEFGRTPTMEGRGRGRDHNPSGYSMWLAGGGVHGGQSVGQTDPIGYTPVERPVGIHDLHATILFALGLDQHQLTHHHRGRDELATVLGGKVVHEVFS